LVEKKCPSCGREVQKLKEESYFFKLSKYEKPLLEHYQKYPEFLSPKHRASEILNFVKSGLRDLSVSRTRVKWGVPVPFDPHHVVYVWFDALLNYISGPGFDGSFDKDLKAPFSQRWPANVHLVGKEIFRFHTVIWPAMLMALGLPLPKKVFAHGWWTVEGEKMSKSVGNVVDPHKMAQDYGVDPFRYFLLREVNFGSDGDFSEKALLTRYNSELANNLGNLLQRTVTLTVKNLGGLIPEIKETPSLLNNLKEMVSKIDEAYNRLSFDEVLETLYGLMVKTNQYIDTQAPWKMGADQKDQLSKVLYECLSVLKVLAVFFHPFMPSKTQELWARLGEQGSLEEEGKKMISQYKEGKIPPFSTHQKVSQGDPLFMRKGGRWK